MFALLPASSHGLAYSLIDPQNSPAAPYHPLTATPNIHRVLCHPLSFLCLDRFQSGIHLLTKTPATATALCHPLSTSPTNHILNRKLYQFLIFYQLWSNISIMLADTMVLEYTRSHFQTVNTYELIFGRLLLVREVPSAIPFWDTGPNSC